MSFRTSMCSALVAVAISSPLVSQTAAAPATSATDSTVIALADRYVARLVRQFPEQAESSGIPNAPHDRLTDNSLAAVRSWESFEDTLRGALARVDERRLAGRTGRVVYGYLREALEASNQGRVCRGELWPVSIGSGWQVGYAQLAAIQPVGTPEARAQALERWQGISHYVKVEIENLREGMRLGYTVPKQTVATVNQQLESMMGTSVDSLPFMDPANRDGTPEFRAAWRALIADSIVPAARRYHDFLRDEYMSHARASVALSALPNGAACYRALLRQSAGIDSDPRALFRRVAQGVTRDSIEMIKLGVAAYGKPANGAKPDEVWLRSRIETDSAGRFPSADSIRAFSEDAVRRAKAALPKWFGDVPQTDVVLTPFPAFQQPSAPGGQYQPAAMDGSHPGIYYYRTYPPVLRVGLQNVVYHETWPGHHLQSVIAQANPASHPITQLVWFSGFGEGWANYTERLADEMGLYSTPVDRLGPYAISLAPLLVADIGVQVLGWTPKHAVDYLVGHVPGRSPDRLAHVVDFMISTPGYIASYTVGRLEIEQLRAQAEQRLGSRFDIRDFHRLVLEDGAIPLWLLREKVERWPGGALLP